MIRQSTSFLKVLGILLSNRVILKIPTTVPTVPSLTYLLHEKEFHKVEFPRRARLPDGNIFHARECASRPEGLLYDRKVRRTFLSYNKELCYTSNRVLATTYNLGKNTSIPHKTFSFYSSSNNRNRAGGIFSSKEDCDWISNINIRFLKVSCLSRQASVKQPFSLYPKILIPCKDNFFSITTYILINKF